MANGNLGILPEQKLQIFSDRNHLRLASVRHVHAADRSFILDDALPRARLVPELRHSADPIAAIAQIDLLQTAVCSPEDAAAISGPALSGDESVAIIDDGYDMIRLRVTAADRRVLVVSD